jgi:hypothetical protein
MKARFADGQPAFSSAAGDAPQVRSRPRWALGRQFLLQRTEIPVPGAPGSLTIVSSGPQADAYTQHYHDSSGVARWYAMTLPVGCGRSRRSHRTSRPWISRQRFTGTFSDELNVPCGQGR